MGTGKLRISQCMIVKNEEKNIERALSWGKEIMWEQIVVDTGSTDRTVEIAEQMGAKIYHFDWIDDFAAAKNFAIEQASGDWIAFLDADEYMLPEDTQKLPSVIKKAHKAKMDILFTLWLQVGDTQMVDMAARQCRIFRNTPRIRYQEPIHEQLTYNGGSIDGHTMDAVSGGGTLSIYHTGYTSEVSDQKSKRNIHILLKEQVKRPEDPDVMGYLGDAYKGLDDKEEAKQAADWYRKALPYIFRSGRRSDRDVYTAVMLMLIYYKEGFGREAEALELYEKASAYFTGIYDLDYLMGFFYVREEEYRKAEPYLERTISMMEKYGTTTFNPMTTGNIPEIWKAIGVCYYENGKPEKCVSCCVGILKLDKTRMDVLALLLLCFKNENPQAVVGFLQKLYDINSISDRVIMLRAALNDGPEAAGVLQELRRYCTPEELAVLDKGNG